MYKTLEVLGPEHEFSIVSHELKAMPIADRFLKDLYGRIVNCVKMDRFAYGKELQLHVLEMRPNRPFRSPHEFEETMHEAVVTANEFLRKNYGAALLGLGMHPLLELSDTRVWPHRHRKIYEELSRIFNLQRHGWLNIQSFQLNLPYSNEKEGIRLHNALAEICAFLPAIAASSPAYEGRLGEGVDNRLRFYAENQIEIPSITGDVVPEYMNSFSHYRSQIIEGYSSELIREGAGETILGKEWINSRGVIFRFDRKALEIRVMDEQECIKSDVALGCFIRALMRSMINKSHQHIPHAILVRSFKAIVSRGLDARVRHPLGNNARDVCKQYFHIASEEATSEEREYLPIIKSRIEKGSLSETLHKEIMVRSMKTTQSEAIADVYMHLTKNLIDNEPYF